MGRIQDKRDREREAIYRQYVVSSKSASKFLLLLLVIALYLSYIMYENRKDVEAIEETIQSNLQQVYGPLNLLIFEEMVAQALDTVKYDLPIIQKPLSNREFFVFSPLVFFIVTWFYWIYLTNSQRELTRLKAYIPPTLISFHFYPWFFWLPFRSVWIRVAWQVALELWPIVFLSMLFISFLSSIEYYHFHAIITLVLTAIPIVIHMRMFQVKYPGPKLSKGVFAIVILSFTALFFIVFIADGGGERSLSLSFWSIFSLVYLFLFVDDFLFGHEAFSGWVMDLMILPVDILIWIVLWFVRREPPSYILRGRFKPLTPVFGYVGYVIDRYHELRALRPITR